MAALRETLTSASTAARVLRAAIYVRVSTASQEQDGTSLATQEQRCRAYATERGWIVANEHVYVEVHSGAYLWERPQLTRLREAMRVGAFDVVIVYAIDRLSREQDHLGLIVSEAQHYGCTLAAVTEDWDNSPLGKFLRGATAFAGELERAKILERTSRGKRALAVSGRPLFGKKPLYGYRINEERTAYVIYEPEARIVRRIFREIAAGTTLRGLARILTREGVPIPCPTPTNQCRWDHTTIQRICQTPAYWGQPVAYRWHVQRKQLRDKRTGVMRSSVSPVVRDAAEHLPLPTSAIPPIVDPQLAAEIAPRLAHNRRHVRRPPTHDDALLQGGYGVCGLCGGPLMVKRVPGRSPSYHCRRKDDADMYPCQFHSMSAAKLDPAVWRRVSRALKNPDFIIREIEARQAPDSAAADLAAFDHRLAEIAAEQQAAAYAITKLPNERAAEPLVAQLTRLDEERAKLEKDRQEVLARAATWQANRTRLVSFQQRCRQVGDRADQLTMSERRDALYALGITVALYPKDRKPRWEIVSDIDLDALAGPEGDPDGNDSVIGAIVVTIAPCSTMRAASRAFSGG